MCFSRLAKRLLKGFYHFSTFEWRRRFALISCSVNDSSESERHGF